jgi:O-antigen ligase
MAVARTPDTVASADQRQAGASASGDFGPSYLTWLAAVERWALRVATFILPLTYCWFTYDSYVLPKLLVARLLVLTLAGLYLARAALTGRLMVKRTPLDLPLIAFIASALLSAVVGVNANVGIFGTYARYDGALTLVTYAALFWLTTQSIADAREARTLIRILVASGFAVGVVAIIQWTGDVLAGSQVAKAYGTMGNANVLGVFLVLLGPPAYGELIAAKSAIARVLAANALTIILLALVLTVSRSSWLGLAVAAAILLVGRQVPAVRTRLALAVVAVVVAAAGAVALVGIELDASSKGAVSSTETVSTRLHVWQDTISLVASRPIAGYGPDTFGLVYPRFQSGNWGYYAQFDKAHSELLQVAATQGLIGVATYLWLLLTFVRAFWRGRGEALAWSLFAGWAGYEATLQLNFTSVAAALPFWIFVAAALVLCHDDSASASVYQLPRMTRLGSAAGVVAVSALSIPALGFAYVGDHSLLQAVEADIAGRPAAATAFAATAHGTAPQESVYAVEVGNVAFERRDWVGARKAYSSAESLGTFNPQMFRNLAIADRQLGLFADAVAAARAAVYLDRFDPLNQAILAQMEAPQP